MKINMSFFNFHENLALVGMEMYVVKVASVS